MAHQKASIFISHAWGGLSDEILAQLVKRLESENIRFVLDKRDLPYRQSIRDFMIQLGEADMVIIILSNKYLKSEYCMFELLEIHKNENLRERIFPIVLDEVKISSSSDRLEFVKYWEKQLIDLQNKVKELNSLTYIEGITEDLNLYSEIRNNIARLTGILRDINTLNIKLHQDADYNDLILAIKRRISGKGQGETDHHTASKEAGKTSILDSIPYKRVVVILFALFGLFMAWGILTKSKTLAGNDTAVNEQVSDTQTTDSSNASKLTDQKKTDSLVNTSVIQPEGNTGQKENPIPAHKIEKAPKTAYPKPKVTSPPSADPVTTIGVTKSPDPKEERVIKKEEAAPVQPKKIQTTTIPKGTELFARSNSTLSSDDGFTTPKKVTFSLDKPYMTGGQVVIPAGSTIVAKVTYIKPSHQTRAGVLDFIFEYLQAPDGQKIPLQSDEFHLVAKGDYPMEISTQSIYKIKTSSTLQINY